MSWMGLQTIYGSKENTAPYMFRAWIGRLRFHIFFRGDEDPDPHDHPWDFWTFPLRSYVEEVTERILRLDDGSAKEYIRITRQPVKAFRLHYRPATYTHRVLGSYNKLYFLEFGVIDRLYDGRQKDFIPTIVWTSRKKRNWGFLKMRDGRWCWVYWKDYVFYGRNKTPCGDE